MCLVHIAEQELVLVKCTFKICIFLYHLHAIFGFPKHLLPVFILFHTILGYIYFNTYSTYLVLDKSYTFISIQQSKKNKIMCHKRIKLLLIYDAPYRQIDKTDMLLIRIASHLFKLNKQVIKIYLVLVYWNIMIIYRYVLSIGWLNIWHYWLAQHMTFLVESTYDLFGWLNIWPFWLTNIWHYWLA